MELKHTHLGTGESGNTGKLGQVMLETPFLPGADREGSQGVGKQKVSQQFGGVLYRAVAQYEAPQCESRWERRLAWGKAVATKLGEQLGGCALPFPNHG